MITVYQVNNQFYIQVGDSLQEVHSFKLHEWKELGYKVKVKDCEGHD